jgi:hypothetical protein
LFQPTLSTQAETPEEGTLNDLVDVVLSSEEKKARDLLKTREYRQKYILSKKAPEEVEVKKTPTTRKRKASEEATPEKTNKQALPFSAFEHERFVPRYI